MQPPEEKPQPQKPAASPPQEKLFSFENQTVIINKINAEEKPMQKDPLKKSSSASLSEDDIIEEQILHRKMSEQ